MRRRLRNFFAAVIVLAPASVSQAEVEILDSIAAIVNDDVILISEIQERYTSYMDQMRERNLVDEVPPRDVIVSQIVERLIVESIQLQEGALRGITISDEELAEGIGQYAQSIDLTADYFKEELEKQGINYNEFREDMRRQLLLQRVQRAIVGQRIFISMQEIEDFRNSPIFEDISTEEYRLGHIMLSIENSSNPASVRSALESADEIVGQLRDGRDFANMAIQHSSASTALEGGDLGWRKLSAIPSLFSDVVQELEVGGTSEPIQNALGVHIVQLLEKRGASTERQETSHVRHILITPTTILPEEEASALAEDLRAQVVAGADFEALAKEYSDDPGSSLVGGDLGWANPQSFVPEFAEKINESEIGETSVVFKTDFGYHFLQVIERREEDLTEEALNNLAYQELFNQRFDETYQAWVQELRDTAFVRILQEAR